MAGTGFESDRVDNPSWLSDDLRESLASRPRVHPSVHGLPHPGNFRYLAETTSLFGLLLVNVDGRIQSWNRGAFDLSGFTTSDVIGQPLHRFIKIEPKQRYQYDDALWRANQSEDAQYQGRRFMARKDGTFVPVLMAVNAIRNDHEELLAYGISLSPASETEDIERDLQDSLTLLRTIIETLPEPLYVKDREGHYLLVNSAFAHHIGVNAEKLKGCSDADLYPVDICALQEATDREVLDTQNHTELEFTIRNAESTSVVRTTKLPFLNSSGQICGVIGLCRDITEERRRESEREKWFAQEQEARRRAEAMLQRLEVIHSIGDHALSHLDPTALIENLLDTAQATLEADTSELWLIQPESNYLTPYLRLGYEKNADNESGVQKIEVGSGLIGQVARNGKRILAADRREHEPGHLFESPEIRGFIAAPLYSKGAVLGAIALSSTKTDHFEYDDFYILNLVGDRIANAIERRNLFAELSSANAAMHRLSHRLLEAQEEERRHLARELHDEIGQILTSIKLSLNSIPRGASPSDLNQFLKETSGQVDEAIKQVRRLSAGLRPPTLDLLGLEAALRECWDRMVLKAGLNGTVQADPIGRQDNDLEITLFRIAQESVTNVIRHARASRVDLTLRKRQQNIVLSIADDGVGFNCDSARAEAQCGRSYGLRSMEERALLLGGSLEIKSRPGKGTLVRASIPIEPDARVAHVDVSAKEYAKSSREHQFDTALDDSDLEKALLESTPEADPPAE